MVTENISYVWLFWKQKWFLFDTEARARIESTAAVPSLHDRLDVSLSDHLAGTKIWALWRALLKVQADTVDLELGRERKKGKRQAEESTGQAGAEIRGEYG